MQGATSRRSLLASFGLVAGGASALGASSPAQAGGPVAPKASLPQLIFGVDWRLVRPGVAPGTFPPLGTPSLPQGRLVDEAGADLGRFHASVLTSSGPGTHLHQFDFADGTLSAVGPATTGEATYAVIGGTGRFAGATGTYLLRQRPAANGGTAEFVLNITSSEV